MTELTELTERPESPRGGRLGLHLEVQYFYDHQVQLIDEGLCERWAETFTEDAWFDVDVRPAQLRGRAAIEAAARESRAKLSRADVQRRHWLGMLTVRPQDDGTLHTRCYALVVSTPRGAKPELTYTTVCQDVLVSDGSGGWLVAERQLTQDSLG